MTRRIRGVFMSHESRDLSHESGELSHESGELSHGDRESVPWQFNFHPLIASELYAALSSSSFSRRSGLRFQTDYMNSSAWLSLFSFEQQQPAVKAKLGIRKTVVLFKINLQLCPKADISWSELS